MPGGQYDSSLTRVQPLFSALLERDRSGRSWLPGLLYATPNGRAVFGDLVDSPGSLLASIASPGADGVLQCFEYPVAAPRKLLEWFIKHPDKLVWPAAATFSKDTTRLRRELLYDHPIGSRQSAQALAREALALHSPGSRGWWRFEGTTKLDCA